MMNNRYIPISFLVLLIGLTSCGNFYRFEQEETESGSSVDTITQIAPTREIYSPEATASATAEAQIPLDPTYYDGIIAITTYYTFLGHGLPEEAYWLLSTNNRNLRTLEDFVTTSKMWFKTVEIISIVPFHEDVRSQGGISTPDPPDHRRFTVKIRAWGEGKMSGSMMSGDLQHLFITLVLEDGKWKIDQFSTSP